MPYFTAHVILLFRVTSADKRVALYLRIGLHYLMCVASCNIRLFVYTYFMYSIEEKCRIFSYRPPLQQSMHFKREYCSGNDRVTFEQDKKSGTQKHHNRNQEQQELKVKLTLSCLCLSDVKTAKFMYVSLVACILQCNAVEGL